MNVSRISVLYIPVLLVLALACKSVTPEKSVDIRVAFYNVENLFDTEDDAQKSDEDFTPEGRLEWTAERYNAKLNKLAQVIDSLGAKGNGPDILGVCEVENSRVLNDLIQTNQLLDNKYAIEHAESPDERGIDVALLYKPALFMPFNSRLYPVQIKEEADFITRSILLVQGKVGRDTLHVLVNHWPSKRGGDEASRYKRVRAAEVLADIRDSLISINSEAKILAMGDFNDEPESVPLSKTLPSYSTTDSLNINAKAFYNPMWSVKIEGKGSYRYRDQWNMLDNFLLSKGLVYNQMGLGYLPGSAQVFNPYWLQQHGGRYEGYPNRTYAGNNYLAGYSDHFPIYLDLSMKL